MASNLSVNGTTVNLENYSSPVLLIGLYCAAANLVCFVLILSDVWAGFRDKKFCFPCRLFPLNSITITLISIATKIPVDLTTNMPSAVDQLSKLSGTVFICLTIDFMRPSVGVKGAFESYANVIAFSIFVITVIVNICIQMAIGVIFCFTVEHSVIMFCMLLLLIKLWVSVITINSYKSETLDQNKDLIRKGEQSMLQRLKVCYIHGYNSSPQFMICKNPDSCYASSVCMISSLVLMVAMVRSLVFKDFKFHGGASDYGWSMWLIVVSQTLTVFVASLAIGFRWLISACHVLEDNEIVDKLSDSPYRQLLYLFSLTSLPSSLELILRYAIFYPLAYLDCLLSVIVLIVSGIAGGVINTYWKGGFAEERLMDEFEGLVKAHQVVIEPFILRKGVEHMERWMEMNKRNCPKHLIELLSTISPSSQDSHTIGLNAGREISSLSVLILVEIAKVATPTSMNTSLTNILGEVFEIIHFIDDNIKVGSSKDKLRSTYAKILWKFGLISEVADKNKVEECMNAMDRMGPSKFESKHVLGILREYQESFTTSILCHEARAMVNFIHRRSYASSKELYDHIVQLLVDMLHVLLTRLPDAIFNHILESPIEEYENRVRLGLALICKLESLESHLRLSFPKESNIFSLITSQISATKTRVEGIITPDIDPVLEDFGETQAGGPFERFEVWRNRFIFRSISQIKKELRISNVAMASTGKDQVLRMSR